MFLISDLENFIAATLERFGRIDAVVNCTGHGPKGPIMEISDEDWHLGMDYYLLNVIRMARLVLPAMQAQKSGSIVNISSNSSLLGEAAAQIVHYGGVKGFVNSFSKSLAWEWAKKGVRVNNICPGWASAFPK